MIKDESHQSKCKVRKCTSWMRAVLCGSTRIMHVVAGARQLAAIAAGQRDDAHSHS